MSAPPTTPQNLFPTEVQGGAGGGGLFGGGINPTAVQWQAQQQQRYNQVTGLANLLNWAATSGRLPQDVADIAGGKYLQFLGEKDPYKSLPKYTQWLQETIQAHQVGSDARQQAANPKQPGQGGPPVGSGSIAPPPGATGPSGAPQAMTAAPGASGAGPAALPATPNGQIGPTTPPLQAQPSVPPPPGMAPGHGFGIGYETEFARNQAMLNAQAMAPETARIAGEQQQFKQVLDNITGGHPENATPEQLMQAQMLSTPRYLGGIPGAMFTAQATNARYGYGPDGKPLPQDQLSAYTQALVGRMNAQAGQDQYKTTPIGVFDTKTGTFVEGASYNQPVTVTPELQQQDPILRQFKVGEVLTPQALASLYRANAAGTTVYQSGAGPAALNKVGGQVTPLPGGPVSWGAPKDVINPSNGMPALMPAGQAMKTGAVPTTPSVAQGQIGIRGQMSDIDSNLPRLQQFINSGTFDNLGIIKRGIIAEALKNPESTAGQIALSAVQGSLTNDQINAIATLKNMYAALGGVRKLLGNTPIASDKRYQAFTTELIDPSDILSGGRVASMRLQNFARAYGALRQPMEQYLNREGIMGGKTPQPPPGGNEPSLIYARDPSGKLHKAPAGSKLPQGWKAESAPAGQ